jgi:hypothetical protein
MGDGPNDGAAERIVLTHPEQGIYVGNAMGLGFWSNWEAAGQDVAVSFDDEAAARAHVSTWDENNDPDAYGYARVSVASDEGYATVAELADAGLGDLLGELRVNTPAIGHG